MNKNVVISQWFEDHLADTGPDFHSNRKKSLNIKIILKVTLLQLIPLL